MGQCERIGKVVFCKPNDVFVTPGAVAWNRIAVASLKVRWITCIGTIVEPTVEDDRSAVVPRITGSAYSVGRNEFDIDPDDSLRDGFRIE